MSGAAPRLTGDSRWYTVRLRGRTGRSTPAIAATSAARGPAALTTQSASIVEPSARRTPAARSPSSSTSTTSPTRSSTPSDRAFRRMPWRSAYASNQPSPARPSDAAARSSVRSHSNRVFSSLGVSSSTGTPSSRCTAWLCSSADRPASVARKRYPFSTRSISGASPSTARYRSSDFRNSTPNWLIWTLRGVLNWSRMLAAESVVDEVRKVVSRSTTTIRPSKSGRPARNVATEEPMMAPPTMTTSARSDPLMGGC